jgi:hypothetical protein
MFIAAGLSAAGIATVASIGLPGGCGGHDDEGTAPNLATTVSAATTYATYTPAGMAATNLTLSAANELTVTGAAPTATATGYVDIPVTSSIIGQQVQVDADRMNLIGDETADSTANLYQIDPTGNPTYYFRHPFNAPTPIGVVNYFGFGADFTPSSTPDSRWVTPVAGQWFTAMRAKQSEVTGDPLTLHRLKIEAGESNNWMAQIVPVLPRHDYFLSFDLNTAGFYFDDSQRPNAQDKLSIKYSFLDSEFLPVTFWDPALNSTGSVQGGSEVSLVHLADYQYEESKLEELRTGVADFEKKFVRKTLRLRSIATITRCTPQTRWSPLTTSRSTSATRVAWARVQARWSTRMARPTPPAGHTKTALSMRSLRLNTPVRRP